MSQVGEVNVFEDAQLLEAGDQQHHLQAIVGYYTDQSAVSPGKLRLEEGEDCEQGTVWNT